MKPLSSTLKWVAGFLERHERILLSLLLCVYIFPIWYHDYFPTLDTPAHIYNANVLWNLWFDQDQLYHHFFESNQWLNPNWISQPLLAVFTQMFSSIVCEKMILSIYIAGFVMAFRSMIRAMNPISPLLSFLCFVFVYNNSFMMGFLNYNFGIIFFLLSVSSLLRFYRHQRPIHSMCLFFLLIALFFSHLVMFCVFGLFAVSFFLVTMIRDLIYSQKVWFFNLRSITFLTLASVIPITLLIVYLVQNKSDEGKIYFTYDIIIKDILRQAGSLSISTNETVYLRWNWIIPIVGLSIAIPVSIFAKHIKGRKESWWRPAMNEVILLLFLVFILAAIFTLPDSIIGGSGLLTDRLIFHFTTFLILGFLLSFRKKMLLLPIVFALMYVSLDRLFFIHRDMSRFQKTCSNIMQASARLSNGGSIAIFNFSDEWLAQHYASHLAVEHHLMILDSWSDKPYNAVKWKSPWILRSEIRCWQDEQWKCNLFESERLLEQKIRWFLILDEEKLFEESKKCLTDWPTFLNDSCEVVYRNANDAILYKRRGI